MKSKLTAGMLAAAALSVFVVQAGLQAGVKLPFAGVSLAVSREVAPPGGIAQVKMEVTEPRPISTGGLRFQSAGWDVAGVAAISPGNDTYGVAQIVTGIWFNSLALIADAVHNVSDGAAIALALAAAWAAGLPARGARTFGWRRAEILAALVNGLALVVISIGKP